MNKKLIVLALICVMVLIAGYYYGSRPRDRTDTYIAPSPYTLPSVGPWDDLKPGTATKDDLYAALGKPSSIKTTMGETVAEYPTDNEYWKNEVYLKNDRVVFIRERIFPPSETAYTVLSKKIKEEPTKLFGPDFEGGIYIMAYPATGVAFETNTSQDTVYQIWRFPPVSLKEFLAMPQAARYGISPKAEPEAF